MTIQEGLLRFFFKYERLHDFCYVCGHTIRDCGDKGYDDDGEEEIQSNYGPWLRAFPMKKGSSSLSGQHGFDSKKELICKPHVNDSSSESQPSFGVAHTGFKGDKNDAKDVSGASRLNMDSGDRYEADVVVGDSRSNMDATHVLELMMFGFNNCSLIATHQTCASIRIKGVKQWAIDADTKPYVLS